MEIFLSILTDIFQEIRHTISFYNSLKNALYNLYIFVRIFSIFLLKASFEYALRVIIETPTISKELKHFHSLFSVNFVWINHPVMLLEISLEYFVKIILKKRKIFFPKLRQEFKKKFFKKVFERFILFKLFLAIFLKFLILCICFVFFLKLHKTSFRNPFRKSSWEC